MKVLTAAQFLSREMPFMIKRYQEKGYPPHRHEFLEFFYVNAGSAVHRLDDNSYALTPGDMVILSPEHEHSFSVVEGEHFDITVCVFTPAFLSDADASLDSVIADIFLRPFSSFGFEKMRFSGTAEVKVRSLLAEMIDEYEKRPNGFRVALRAKLTDLLVTIVRAYDADVTVRSRNADTRKSHAIVDVISFVTGNFRQHLTLESIVSEHTDMTKEYFCVLFKRATGKTFVQHLTDLRLEHAKKLLTSASLSVTEVCFDSGFNDLSHFERIFRRNVGVSPRQFQRAHAVKRIARPA
ncbi:MAG: AraC family transcriptional regulator [Spirochaetota bacterium]